MDKLKQIFSPGSSKDDEVLYGDAEARRQASVGNSTQAGEQKEVEPLRTIEGSKESGGVLRQILNPGGAKHDDHAFGANATTEPVDPKLIQTHPEHQKDHTVIGQILNPGGEKYDEQRYGTTGTTGGDTRGESVRSEVAPSALIGSDAKLATDDTKKDHSILRQIINPGGGNYDDVAYGRNASVVGSEGHQTSQHGSAVAGMTNPSSIRKDNDNASCLSVKSGVEGPFAQNADPVSAGAGTSTLPDRSAQKSTTDDSHLGRDAAVVGGLGAAGAGTYAATHREKEPERTTGSSTTIPATYQSQQPSSNTQTTTHTTTQSSSTPSTYQPTSQQTEKSHLGRDAAVVGGVGAAGAGNYAATHHQNEQKDYAAPPGTAQSTASSAYSQPGTQSMPQQAEHSHLGRDAAIAGGVGAAGAGTYAATRHENEPRGNAGLSSTTQGSTQTTYPQSTSDYTPRDTGISGTGTAGTGAYALDQHIHPQDSNSSTKITDRAHPLSNRGTDAHINPISAPEAPETQADSHFGRNAAIVGGTGLAAGAAASHLHGSSAGTQQTGSGTGYTGEVGSQLNQAPADVQNATFTERAVPLGNGTYGHTSGPHVTDTANRLDPHIPGEFPTEEGDDPHRLIPASGYSGQSSTGSGLGATTGTGLAGAGTQSYPAQSSTTTSSGVPSQAQTAQPTSEHHYGRDAALGGAGLAGAGAAAHGLSEHDKSRQTPGQSSSGYSSGQSYPTQTTTGADPTSASVPSQPQGTQGTSQHHYGRDAAIAGGAGAAGLGAYEVNKSRDDTGPASKTIGPHDSNIANVVDPRVQPEPQKMKQSTTAGPYQSDLANKADPRVDSDLSKHDKGKDAALFAGGAGAGAAAGYGASQVVDEKEQKKLEKQHEKEVEKEHKEAEKEAKKHEKEHQKEVAKEEKAHQKEVAKAEKQHEKEVAKQEKQHEKEVAKAEKQQEKEIAKVEKQHEKEAVKEEKQHEKQLAAEEKEAEKERERREKEAAAAAGVAGVGAGAYEAEKHHHDSSEQHHGRSSHDTTETGHSGGEKKRSLLDKILHPTRKSEDDDRVAADDDGHNKLHKKHAPKPTEQVHQGAAPLASTGQEGLVAGPEYGGRGDGTVTEPHTGLPMNVGQYGSGQGGTDGAQSIEGYHQHPSATGGESAATGPDWNAIKKDNTPY